MSNFLNDYLATNSLSLRVSGTVGLTWAVQVDESSSHATRQVTLAAGSGISRFDRILSDSWEQESRIARNGT